MHLRTIFKVLTLLFCSQLFAANPTTIWEGVNSGKNIVIMRHALAPGNGDPNNFELRNCSTQRNLSERGRQQARAIGEKFHKAGILNAQVYSSQWCRCLDTAAEMNIGTPKEQPFLNSFYGRRELESEQMKNLRAWIKSLDADKATVLVTHQVVITSLTGVFPESGEAVIFRLTDDDEVEVVDTITTN